MGGIGAAVFIDHIIRIAVIGRQENRIAVVQRGFHYPYRDTWVDTSLYDVHFTDVPDFSCVSRECQAQKDYFELDRESARRSNRWCSDRRARWPASR